MNTDLQAQAADVLRRLALDESLKERTMADAATAALARKVAARYIGGETIDDAFDRLPSIFARGHKASIEYTGESVRDPELANAETDVSWNSRNESARRVSRAPCRSTSRTSAW
ncbi:hypothetical protein [Rhodococcus erythropolis]|uniref:hypothetical protein n=1 Tax=Rhodococcus erythropolis TaxID=1833 RepID=UPI0020C7A33C|nr:hypothetical protein [Rhodococcus erythropolis]